MFVPLVRALIPSRPQCDFYGIIPAIEFGCFVGAVGLIDALAGMVSAFMDVIPYIVNLGLDALACLSYVAGGAVSIYVTPSHFSLRCADGQRSLWPLFSRNSTVAAMAAITAAGSRRKTPSSSSGSSLRSSSSV